MLGDAQNPWNISLKISDKNYWFSKPLYNTSSSIEILFSSLFLKASYLFRFPGCPINNTDVELGGDWDFDGAVHVSGKVLPKGTCEKSEKRLKYGPPSKTKHPVLK